jgi:hypothetical protein
MELQWKEIEEQNSAIKWGGWLDAETSLPSEVVPLLSEVVPLLSEVVPLLSEVVPLLSEVVPLLSEVVPLLSEVVPLQVVPIEDLTWSSPSESLLPETVSEALGISLSEVLNLYFGALDEGTRDWMVWDVIDRRRGEEEDMHILQEGSRWADEAEFRAYYEDDMY